MIEKRQYDQELKLAAARECVDGGCSREEVMERYDIVSETALYRWCRAYAEGGEEALNPKPKGRPRKEAQETASHEVADDYEDRLSALERQVDFLTNCLVREGIKALGGRDKAPVEVA